MALRFNKRIKIFPGIKLNVGLGGVSITAGVKGASVNVGKKGAYLNTGIPGTGISSRTKISGTKPAPAAPTQAPAAPTQAPAAPTQGLRVFWMILGGLVVVGFLIWLF